MSNLTCPPAPLLQPIVDAARYATYQIAVPCYLVIGLACQGLLLLALYVQSKTQPLYMYQVFRAVSEMVEVLSSIPCALSMFVLLSAADPTYRSPVPSLNNSYSFVWYVAHAASPLVNSIITTSLLLSASMVADRVFALYKPMVYRSINHKRHQAVAVVLSVSISFGASAFECFRFRIVDGIAADSYAVAYDTKFIGSTAAFVLALSRVLLQAVALAVLVALSVCLIFLYRSRFVNTIGQMSDQKDEKRKQNEKTLTLLTLLECAFDSAGMGLMMAFYVFAYGFPAIYSCYGKLLEPLLDLATMILKTGDFFAIVLASKQFRKMLCESLPCVKMSKNTINVAPAQIV